MDHKEKHHEHHQHEREEKKKHEHQHELQQEKKPRVIHPLWFVAVGILLMVGVLAVWFFFFWGN